MLGSGYFSSHSNLKSEEHSDHSREGKNLPLINLGVARWLRAGVGFTERGTTRRKGKGKGEEEKEGQTLGTCTLLRSGNTSWKFMQDILP